MKYKIGYEINFYNKCKGVFFDFNVFYQGQMDLFEEFLVFGFGMLFNWGLFNFDGEWIFMICFSICISSDGIFCVFDYIFNIGYVCVGYNIMVGKYMLELVFMVMQFNGGEIVEEQVDVFVVGFFFGLEQIYDVGVNLYLDCCNFKLMLYYIWCDGDFGVVGDGVCVN